MKIPKFLLFASALASATAQTYTFSTLGDAGYGNADGSGTAARFAYPCGVAVDGSGNVFVADTGNSTIRKISASGVVTTLAGSAGNSDSADGLGSAARFSRPGGVTVDGSGNVYISDRGNHTLRKITPDGRVTTLAGAAGTSGSADGSGSAARFNYPTGVAVDGSGNVFVADTGNNSIRKITTDGIVTTLAGSAGSSGNNDGTGSTARFSLPLGVAVDGSGNVFVADYYNHAIRMITASGVVTTLAVLVDGRVDANGIKIHWPYTYGPQGVAVDNSGNVFVAEGPADNIYFPLFFTVGGTIRKIAADGVVTTLAGSLDFGGSTDGTGGTARFNSPTSVAVDGSGNLYVADRENNAIRKITGNSLVTTLAGDGGYGSHDGTGSVARYYSPNGVAADGSGNLFVADTNKHAIRKITAGGVVTTLAGLAGSSGSVDGSGSAARFNSPTGVAVDGSGNVFVADGENHTIRKIAADGVVTTLAGTAGSDGSVDGTGAAARFKSPLDLAVDGSGNVFVSDTGNHTIRKITATGVVTTLAGTAGSSGSADGTGSAARFYGPRGVAVDGRGNVFVADAENETIRKITAGGGVTTLAGAAGVSGSADGPGSAAQFKFPRSVAVDNTGNVFVADTGNSTIRKITAAGVVITLAGAAGVSGSADGPGSAARFAYPRGVAVDGSGNVFVADRDNHTIRKGAPSAAHVPASRIVNFSARGLVPAGGDLIVGFGLRGGAGKSVLVRGIGSTLGSFGVADALADPRLDLIPAGASSAMRSNVDWGSSPGAGGGPSLATAFASVGAFPLPAGSRDAAITGTLSVAAYTVRVTSAAAGGSGLVLAEVYDCDTAGAPSRIANVSTLGFAGTGAQQLQQGFVIDGPTPKRLLIRAVGPGLAPFGLSDTLADPQLTVLALGGPGIGALAYNDNWADDATLAAAFTFGGAFPLPAGSKDAAVVTLLPPGAYTVVVSGVTNTTGRAFVEIYDLDP